MQRKPTKKVRKLRPPKMHVSAAVEPKKGIRYKPIKETKRLPAYQWGTP